MANSLRSNSEVGGERTNRPSNCAKRIGSRSAANEKADTGAGAGGNQTGFTQTANTRAPEAPLTSTVKYCYDEACRLTSHSARGTGNGAPSPAELLSTNGSDPHSLLRPHVFPQKQLRRLVILSGH